MESTLYKYSDFIEDDGAFDRVRRDFDALGDDLVKKAKKVKDEIKLFNVDDVEGIKEIEDQAETLTKAFKKYGDAKQDINKIEEAFRKTLNKQNQTTDDQIDKLTKLDKELQKHRTDLKEINKLGTVNGKVVDDVNKARVEAQINIKKVSKEIRDQQKEILKSNELSRKEQKLLQAKITLEKEEIRTLEDVRERMSALRTVVQSLDLDTEADKIAEYNAEINELTEVLSENSDKFIQSKINIGNYEESITNALKEIKPFRGELSVLNGIYDLLTNSIFASEKANEADTKAKVANRRATTNLSKSIKVLNKTAKATGILLLITAIASIGAIFSQGRAGTIATQKALARFNAVAKVSINLLAELGKGIVSIFEGLANTATKNFNTVILLAQKLKLEFLEFTDVLGSNNEKIEETKQKISELSKEILESDNDGYAEGWNRIKKAVSGFGKAYDDAVASIKSSDRGIIEAFKIGDQIKQAELNLIGLRKEVRLLEIDADDSTRSLRFQLEATDKLLEKRVQLLQEEADIERLNLKLANAKARADAEASGFRLSEDDVQFAKELLALNQKLAVTENPLDDAFLEESQQALRAYLSSLDEVAVAEAEIGKQRREISRDLFEQNLDLLIDLIDTEKNLSEQIVNDTTIQFKKRISEFNRFLLVFRQNSQRILAEFTKEAEQLGLDLDFDIQFDEEGNFKVFIGDTELAIDNIVELNEQLQDTGLNEIDINRFREFIVETRNGVRDFKELSKEIRLVGIAVNELRRGVTFSQDEINALDSLQDKINKLVVASRGRISAGERNEILRQIEELEKQKQAITEFADFQRLTSRRDAIDAELDLVEFESQRYFELLQERLDIEKQLREKNIDEILEKTKDANKKALEDYKKFGEDVRSILTSILDKAVEVQQKRIEATEDAVDRQDNLIDNQRRRAELGLENTLAFEERERGKREAERIKEEKRLERLEKIRALYSSYNNYASRGDQNPIVKALRDFSILEAITASFGDGGLAEDKIPHNGKGITRGRSHNGRGGGIPVLIEGNEGFFSGREIENLGKENFYKMKDLASMGKVDSNFFSRQGKQFVAGVPVSSGNPELVKEMKDVKRAIESKPVPHLEAGKIVDGAMEIVERILTKNGETRNRYKTKKPRL